MADQRMSDDEISELAECLEDACQRSPVPVSAMDLLTACCPFGALVRTGEVGAPGRPSANTIYYNMIGLTADEAEAFMCGFDGLSVRPACDERLHALGLQFKERYP